MYVRLKTKGYTAGNQVRAFRYSPELDANTISCDYRMISSFAAHFASLTVTVASGHAHFFDLLLACLLLSDRIADFLFNAGCDRTFAVVKCQ